MMSILFLGGVCKKVLVLRNRVKRWNVLVLIIGLLLVLVAGCGGQQERGQAEAEKQTLVFADAGWDSIQFHNYVAKIIIENGYGYPTEIIEGSTPITFDALRKGTIDIYMEAWTSNIKELYEPAVASGDVIELSVNFDDNVQGLYVPTYLIKGDPERGIEPLAPDLHSIHDLPKYWELFKDPEEPTKGRIFGAIPGWEVDTILAEKVRNYGLDKYYNYYNPGSDAALATSMLRAYENGEPWLGYYWEPTWIMGLLDMTLLADEPYSDELWNNGYRCEFPTVPCTVVVHKDVPKTAPEVAEFLKNYQTSSALTNEALAYMQENEVGPEEAARWFLAEHEELWTGWVPAEVAARVKEAL